MQQFLHRCLNRTPIIGLLMAALLFRALIPTGFMPTAGENGSLVMQLCSGMTTKSVVVDLGLSSDEAPAPTHLIDSSPCGFAVTGHSAAPPSLPVFAAAGSPDSHAVAGNVASRVPASIARAQSPRGPPLI